MKRLLPLLLLTAACVTYDWSVEPPISPSAVNYSGCNVYKQSGQYAWESVDSVPRCTPEVIAAGIREYNRRNPETH